MTKEEPPSELKAIVEAIERKFPGVTSTYEGRKKNRVSISGKTPTGTDVLLTLQLHSDGILRGIYDRPTNWEDMEPVIKEVYDGKRDIRWASESSEQKHL